MLFFSSKDVIYLKMCVRISDAYDAPPASCKLPGRVVSCEMVAPTAGSAPVSAVSFRSDQLEGSVASGKATSTRGIQGRAAETQHKRQAPAGTGEGADGGVAPGKDGRVGRASDRAVARDNATWQPRPRPCQTHQHDPQ